MNCFQHPDQVAMVFCKECNKPLCLDCARQNILGQTHVCSEVCAKLASWRPKPEAEQEDSLFNRLYASVFIVVLLASLGGIFVAWGGQSAHYKRKRMEAGKYLNREDRPNEFVILSYIGITDWRVQFAIGAAIGGASGLIYVRKKVSWKRKP